MNDWKVGGAGYLQLWIHMGQIWESSGYFTRFMRQFSVRDNLHSVGVCTDMHVHIMHIHKGM